MAKKKVAKKKAKKAKKSQGPGRPAGSGNYIPTGLEVRSTQDLSRASALEPIEKAFKRVVLETHDEDYAHMLYKLVATLNTPKGKKCKDLFKFLQSIK